MPRLEVTKTYKLFIKGEFPRTESGRSMIVRGLEGEVIAHVCQGSRKDVRIAVEAARGAAEKWRTRTAYNRAQILYRMAEMLEGKADEFVKAIREVGGADGEVSLKDARAEVQTCIDRLIAYTGWADKYSQVLGCNNPVAGPFYNFTVPDATGVVAVVAPDEPTLLPLISLIAAPLAGGNTIVALASATNPIPSMILAEVCATSDVPPGVINILTGFRAELIPWIADHRDIDGIHAANLTDEEGLTLRRGAIENIKRVRVREVADWFDEDECESPWWIEPFVEMKTIWHPSGA
jgi:acyl-CoA reductase-like NAD-dependent aldehyde dehydrogenase